MLILLRRKNGCLNVAKEFMDPKVYEKARRRRLRHLGGNTTGSLVRVRIIFAVKHTCTNIAQARNIMLLE